MATAPPPPPPPPPPVKSQPLHNFSLPFLKWGASGKNHTNSNHHRCRRPPVLSDHASEPESDLDSRPHRVGSRTARNRFTLPSFSNKQHSPPERGVSNDETGEREREAEHVAEAAEAEETVQKPWNLRPRKPAHAKGTVEIGTGASRNNNNNNSGELQEAVHHHNGGENPAPKSLRLRGFAETQCTERKEKRKFWIALSREEIEEDIFVMTGSRPARRPRKRPKNVQKQMDCVFPGLWLVGITADAYRVADTPAKR
ncbi:uncharacterized protein LOC133284099 [Gastrolobium bilobum]|uniref:uncharacterized protein LOC133284099 n=1 Tax=Gastrolobium bilobum TaxID=150636 RepID=UPI002AAFC6C0|nr:uncharacterized protein LOC133284099 [Gastrolobium bilobum]